MTETIGSMSDLDDDAKRLLPVLTEIKNRGVADGCQIRAPPGADAPTGRD